MKPYLFLTFYFYLWTITGQIHMDFIGAGNHQGITVTSSNNFGGGLAENTINGSGLDAPLMEASRFLSHATMGYDYQMVEDLAGVDNYEIWIDNQINIEASDFPAIVENVWNDVLQLHINAGEDPDDVFGPYALHFNYGWWTMVMSGNDLLRQKTAYALSQILVISNSSDLRNDARAVASYYDILMRKGLDNYYDMLMEVSLHPTMGYYLSHFNNPKADPAKNIHPDENYAREIMQLFTIGLYELNLDGTRKKDVNGNDIPTYNNDDIKEFAKIFTGLGPGDINDYVDWTEMPYFGLGVWGTDMTVPMIMYENWHEPGEKNLLNGYTIPSGQTGMEDIEDAVMHLFNHDNVGPFLAIRMIQRLIKSNPSPAYVSRVASVFNNNGQGERGDMAAVVKAILVDPEARSCNDMLEEENGRLREATLRMAHFAKAMPIDNPFDRYWNNGYDMVDALKQHPMMSPSVFNFYTHDHTPNGSIGDQGLVAPEFKIHNSTTSINYLNYVNRWTEWETLWWSWHGDYGDVNLEVMYDEFADMVSDPEILLNYMDVLFAHGQLTDETRNIIRTAMNGLGADKEIDKAIMGFYLMLISPDYNISK